MSILGKIFGKIFGTTPAAAAETPAAGAPSAATTTAAAPAAPAPIPMASVDVTAMLDDLASSAGQKLNWRVSIVDLMKLLDLDSSLGARKELAKELHYTGDMNDSASMNIWLHKQVMVKLAANGGKVPDELK
jgi:hypothetical protein